MSEDIVEKDVLVSINELESLRKQAVQFLVIEVQRARNEGLSWENIARALGILRTSAMARYKKFMEPCIFGGSSE